jgi:hypothetical protein
MQKDKIITAKEAAKELREELGMSITAETLRDGIAQGQFSFGSYIKTEKSCVCYVYTRLLAQWIAERQ